MGHPKVRGPIQYLVIMPIFSRALNSQLMLTEVFLFTTIREKIDCIGFDRFLKELRGSSRSFIQNETFISYMNSILTTDKFIHPSH